MPSVPTVASALQHLLIDDARRLATETGTVQRTRKFDGASLAQTLVVGWLDAPNASLGDLCQMAASIGVTVTRQGLNKRFTASASTFFQRLLTQATEILFDGEAPESPLLNRFTHVYLDDSSTVSLPDELAGIWSGCGGSSGGEAAVKLQVRLDLCHGGLQGPILQDGRAQDKVAPQQTWPVEADAVRITDLGYASFGVLKRLTTEGGHWLCRYHPSCAIRDAAGRWWHPTEVASLLATVGEEASLEVVMGKTVGLPCRLLVQRVPPAIAAARRERLQYRAERKGQTVSPVSLALADWSMLLTSVPASRLSVAEGMALYRARWQIELLFKLWKSGGLIDEWRTTNPHRILCELYAKLLGCLLQHWLLLDPCWGQADRSLVQAAATVRRYALALALAFHSQTALRRTIRTLRRCLAALPRLDTRRAKPSTPQRLRGATDGA